MSSSISEQKTKSVPDAIVRTAELMSTFPGPWALSGGWAVDAWLGRETREHTDIDIAIFAEDQRALFEHLAGWRLAGHVFDDTHQPWDGRHLDLPNHIEARLEAGEGGGGATQQRGLDLDVYLNERSGGDWIVRHEPRVAMPLRRAVRQCGWGVPTLAPELLLVYKAGELRLRDRLDFGALRPELDEQQCDWLKEAIERVGHPWLAQLSRAEAGTG